MRIFRFRIMPNLTGKAKSRVVHRAQTRFIQSAIQHGDSSGTEIERVGVKEGGQGDSDSGSLVCYDQSVYLHFFCVLDDVHNRHRALTESSTVT